MRKARVSIMNETEQIEGDEEEPHTPLLPPISLSKHTSFLFLSLYQLIHSFIHSSPFATLHFFSSASLYKTFIYPSFSLIMEDETLKSLSLDYLNLLINGQAFSDVTFTVDGRLVHAHRCILAARSLFFRKFFADPPPAARSPRAAPVVVPVSSVGYEVFLLLLQFIYSGHVSVVPGKHEPRADCGDRGCWHTHCSSAVDLALQTLAAARSFGVEQLAAIVQKQLGSMVEKASIEDVMKVLTASHKQDLHELWSTCSHLVAKSGLPPDVLAKHLPVDLIATIQDLRRNSHQPNIAGHRFLPANPSSDSTAHKLRRMRRALDSSDVELVKLMVMGEGLNLDDALALHYAVRHCTREVVKALLELGAADVNRPAGPNGQTALHVAAEMACPDMVAVLLDHHADPGVRAADGSTPLDILRGLTSDFLFKGVVPGLPHVEPNRLRLCLELVQSAAQVMSREDAASREIYPSMDTESDRCEAECSLGVDSRILYLNLGMASAAHLGCKIDDSTRHQGDGGIGSSSMFSSQGFP